MIPAARIQAAIGILDRILAGDPAEAALLRWSRASRYAGSGDRAAVRDLVFDSLRRKASRAALGGAMSGRGLMIGMCRAEGLPLDGIFSSEGHAPAALSDEERAAGREPDATERLDLPQWLWPEWQQALGERAAETALALRERAPVWLRVNSAKASVAAALQSLADDGIAATPSGVLDTALEVTQGARRIAASAAYREGLVELQDLSPQLACAALPVAGSVLDYCAGGGGKALALAARGANPVSAHDIDAGRMADLPERARRAGAKIRLLKPGQIKGRFDLVMTDVPCSGSGTWRRTPDAKWRLSEADLDCLTALQSAILTEAAALVGDGGALAYMTCSVLPRENHERIVAFLAADERFSLESEQGYGPGSGSDGFYLAVLRRR